MKKVINGKMYNTETAKEICNYYNGKPWNDFYVFASELYQTKKGSFFVFERAYDQEEIVVLNESEAKEYVEKYGNVDDYIKTFGDVEEA